MDPNKTLERLRELVSMVSESHEEWDGQGDEPVSDVENEFMENFEALDGWISNGGFLPKDWSGRT